jgi:hypothetical protein
MKIIGLWIDNLMDKVRVGDHLQKNGFQVESVPDQATCHKFLQTKSGIAIIDLQSPSLDLDEMRDQFADQPELLKRIVCFFPHVQIHLKRGAQKLGIKHVYPRSVFFKDPIVLIQKVGESSKS